MMPTPAGLKQHAAIDCDTSVPPIVLKDLAKLRHAAEAASFASDPAPMLMLVHAIACRCNIDDVPMTGKARPEATLAYLTDRVTKQIHEKGG